MPRGAVGKFQHKLHITARGSPIGYYRRHWPQLPNDESAVHQFFLVNEVALPDELLVALAEQLLAGFFLVKLVALVPELLPVNAGPLRLRNALLVRWYQPRVNEGTTGRLTSL